jgi:sulfate transport system substrate-binding protein
VLLTGIAALPLAVAAAAALHSPIVQAQQPPKAQTLTLVSYAVTKNAYDQIFRLFADDWKKKTGQTVTFKGSYGGSGSQTRAVIDGLNADIVNLAMAADVSRIEQAGLIRKGWERRLPNSATPIHSTVVAFVRSGNPKKINSWKDLAKPNVDVVTANPKTSGGARWNFLGLWGSISQTGGTEAQAKAYVASVYRNVENLPKDAREASDVFLKRGQGDVLLNYENEAILAKKTGDLKAPFIVPEVNIRIEGPVTVVDRNVDRKGTRKAAEALAAYLQSDAAQEILAEEGFRPVSPSVWSRVKARFAPVKQLFSASDFGGWTQINETFFGKRGVWDELFRASR